MLGEEKSGTQIHALNREFWQNGVKPHSNALLSAMSSKLLSGRMGAGGVQFAIDPLEMFRGDVDSMVKLLPALGNAQTPGVMSPTEFRRMMGLPAQMEAETETDRRCCEELKNRQAGLPLNRGIDNAGEMGKMDPESKETEDGSADED